MPAQTLYLTSIITSFSTFLDSKQCSASVRDEALLVMLRLLEVKKDFSHWNLETLDSAMSDNKLTETFSPASTQLVRQFVHKHPPYQTDVFLHEYLLALKADNCSFSTIRNYRSDIVQFFDFCGERDISKVLSKPKVVSFLKHEQQKGLKGSSIYRKLVSICQFAFWLEGKGILRDVSSWLNHFKLTWEKEVMVSAGQPDTLKLEKPKGIRTTLPINPPQDFAAHTAIDRQEYRTQLKNQFDRLGKKVSAATPNFLLPYLNSVLLIVLLLGASYFGYVQLIKSPPQPFAYPATPNRPYRSLSFQGRLTDTAENPITSASDMRFKLFTDPSGGTELWDSGTCSITPDQDGIFSAGLGDECGSEISENVFSENASVYLEVTIEGETLDPRQPIKAVAYALNSETLQGYPIDATGAATMSTVVTMNDVGQVVLGEVSPKLKSVSGTFAIEAQALSLQTAAGSNGDISLSPDGTGEINLNANTVVDGSLTPLTADEDLGSASLRWDLYANTINADSTVTLTGLGTGTDNTVLILDASNNVTTDEINPKVWDAVTLIDGTGTANRVTYWTDSDTVAADDDFFFDGSNVGIGTTTATQKLTVSGNMRLTGAFYDGVNSAGTAGYVLSSTGTGTQWADPAVLAGGTNLWDTALGAIYPKNSTTDLLVGGTSTASAKFAFMNVNSGTPTASISAGTAGATTLTATGVLGTTAGQNLTLGNSTTGNLTFAPAGSTAMTILQNGNVGIGNTAPNGMLDVSGQVRIRNASTALVFTGNSAAISFSSSTGTKSITTGGTTDLEISPGGNVGIATTTMRAKLDIEGSASSSGTLSFRGTTDPKINILNGEDFSVSTSVGGDTGLANRLTVFNNGNVGIGTTAAQQLLTVGGTVRANGLVAHNGSGQNIAIYDGTDFRYGPSGAVGSNLIFSLNGERMRITSAGNVGIGGDTTPDNLFTVGSTSQFQVNSSGAIAAATGVVSSGNIDFASLSAGGLVKAAATTGRLSIATSGTDYEVPLTFNNGLTRSSNTIKLGGPLTAATDIALSGFDFTLSGTGNVGIGTTAATQKLDINGSLRLRAQLYDETNSVGTPGQVLSTTATGTDWIDASGVGTNYWQRINGNLSPVTTSDTLSATSSAATVATFTTTGTNDAFRAGSTTAYLRVDSSGNLLPDNDGGSNLGSSALRFNELFVKGATINIGDDGDSGLFGYSVASDYFSFDPDNDATAEFVMTDGGNFGIGSTSPVARLDVGGGNIALNGGWLSNDGGNEGVYVNAAGNVGVGGDTTPDNLFTVGSTSQFQVNSTGGVAAATGVVSSGNIDFASLSAGGLVKAAATTGRLSIATSGTDYEVPLTFNNGLTRTSNTIKLGGALTANTDVALSGFNMAFSGTGNVSIGTTAAAERLQVAGNILLSNGANRTIAVADQTSGGISGNNLTIKSGASLSGGVDGGDLILTAGAAGGSGGFGGSVFVYPATGGDGDGDVILAHNGTSSIGNVGVGTATPGVKLDVNGDIRAASGSDYYLGSIGFNDNGTTSSGASLIGLNDDSMTYISANTNVQSAIKQLDTAIGTVAAGSSKWTDAGSYIYPTNGEVLGNSAAAGANKLAGIYLADSAPLNFGTDNDIDFSFSGTTLAVTQGNNDINFDSNTLVIDGSESNVGIGTTSTTAKLAVAGGIDLAGGAQTIKTTGTNAALTLQTNGTGTLTLDSGTTGIVNLGTSANAKTINIGTGAAVANTINIGGTGANTLAIGTSQTGGSIAIGSAMTTGTITIGGTGLQTGTIDIGTGTGAQTINLATGGTGVKTVNLGTGAVANVVTVGSQTGAASLALRSGTGDITLSSTDQILINSSKASGGTTTEAFSIKSTADLAAADEVLQVGDSAGDFMTILGNGNVGVGTTSPTQKLDVNGTVRLRSQLYDENNSVGTAGQILSTTATGTDWIDAASVGTDDQTLAEVLGFGNTTSAHNIVMSTTDELRFYDDDNDSRIYAASDGNITLASTNIAIDTGAWDITAAGVGTGFTQFTVDNLTLDGNTLSSGSGAVTIAPLSGQNLNVNLATTGDFIVNTNDLVVDTSTGNVGIGSTTPAYSLDVAGQIRASSTSNSIFGNGSSGGIQLGDGSITKSSGNIFIFDSALSSGGVTLGNPLGGSPLGAGSVQLGSGGTTANIGLDSAKDIVFYTSGAATGEIMRLQASAGNIGIGDATPTYKLDVNGTGRFTGAVDLDGDLELNSTLTDINGAVGTAGQILSSTGTGVDWVDASAVGTNYWQRVAGNLSPVTTSDTLSATSSAATVATFTTTGTNDAFRAGSSTAYLRIDSSGNLLPDNDGGSNLGSSTLRFNELFVKGATINMGDNGDSGLFGYNVASDYFSFDPDNDATAEFVMTDTGNFGVGTTAPAYPMEVQTAGQNIARYIAKNDNVNWGGVNYAWAEANGANEYGFTIGGYNASGNKIARFSLNGSPTGFSFQAGANDVYSFEERLLTKAGIKGAYHTDLDIVLEQHTNGGADTGIKFKTNGGSDTRMTILEGGNVGIGSAIPAVKLDVVGDIRTSTDYYVGAVGLNDNGSTSSGASLVGLNDDSMTYVSANTNVQSAIKQLDTAIAGVGGGAPAWNSITAPTGNLSLAMDADTTSFSYNTLTSGTGWSLNSSATAFTGTLSDITLSGSNAANTGTLLAINNTGTSNANTSMLINHYATGTNNLAFRVNDVSGDTSPFIIDGTGNVGIGTTTISEALSVNGNILGNKFTDTNGSGAYYLDPAAGGTSLVVAGNIGIGSTSPAQKLDVVGNGLFSGNVGIGTTSLTNTLAVNGSGRFYGAYTETSSDTGVQIGYLSSSPRILFGNGNNAQNWQIDNNAGNFRWYTPGTVHLELSTSILSILNKAVQVTGTSNTNYFMGNMGIGTTSNLGAQLAVDAGSGGTGLRVEDANVYGIDVGGLATNAVGINVATSGSGNGIYVNAGGTGIAGSFESTSGTAIVGSGNWRSNVVQHDYTAAVTGVNQTTTVSSKGMIFDYLLAPVTQSAATTVIFDNTGLQNTDGSFAIIRARATKPLGATGNLILAFQIQGATAQLTSITNSGLAGSTATKNVMIARSRGVWHVVSQSISNDTSDLAEWFPYTGTQPKPGEIVAINPVTTIGLVRSEQSYQDGTIGVVTTAPHTVMGEETDQSTPVGLAGRVPVIVTTKNGQIKTGDRITASNYSGTGMKARFAGQTVGRAMEGTDTWLACPSIPDINSIPWPEDDGTNPSKPCFTLPNGDVIGKIMMFIDNSWYEGDIQLDEAGEILIANADNNYAVTEVGSSTPLARISAFSQTIIGQVRAGLVTTKDLVVEQTASIADLNVGSLQINGLSLADYITSIVGNQTPANSTTNQLATVQLNELDAPQFNVVNESDETVASIDQSGNATFSGQLSSRLAKLNEVQSGSVTTENLEVAGTSKLSSLLAENASISGTLNAADASIAGTLTADTADINSARMETLEARMAQLDAIKAQTAELMDATVSGTLYAENIANFEQRVQNAIAPSFLETLLNNIPQNPAPPETVIETVETSGFNASGSGELNKSLEDLELDTDDVVLQATAVFIDQYFKVNGAGYIADSLGIGNSLLIGDGLTITDTSIAFAPSSGETLFKIQPSGSGTLDLMAGLMTLTEDGNVTITGNLAVVGDLNVNGSLLSNLLKPVDYGSPFQVQVAGASTNSSEIKQSRFEIINENKVAVATISAEGRAQFAQGIGVGSEDLGEASGEDAVLESSEISGRVKLVAGTLEVKIISDKITADSLIYVTPVGSTNNSVLYVKSQSEANDDNEGEFVVGFDEALDKDVTFNWWIVN